MKTISFSILNEQIEATVTQMQATLRVNREYLDSGDFYADLRHIGDVYLGHCEADESTMEVVKQVKAALFGTVVPFPLMIPDDFYASPIGKIIQWVEAGNSRRTGKLFTVKDIAAKMKLSRNSIHSYIYDVDSVFSQSENWEGKMAATKTSSGYVVPASEFSRWREWYRVKHYRRKG